MPIVDSATGKDVNHSNLVTKKFSRLGVILKKTFRFIIGKTIPQKLFRLYITIIIVGALFLSSPFCLLTIDGVQLNGFKNVKDFNFLKAFFIACSGFSDTGLTPISIYQYLNIYGQIVLMLLIELGGIGVLALFYYVWDFFRKKTTKPDVGSLYLIQAERGGSNLANSLYVLKKAISFILISQLFFMIIYTFCFCFIPAYQQQWVNQPSDLINNKITYLDVNGISFNNNDSLGLYKNFGKSLWTGLFTTISALNNAGFDNVSSTSFAPYRNDWGTILQFFIVLELIIGGLGHFVWFEIIQKIRYKSIKKTYFMSLYSKIAIVVYLAVAVIGLLSTFCFEFASPLINNTFPISNDIPNMIVKELTIIGNSNLHNEFGNAPMYNKCCCIIFNTFNARSLGMSTVSPSIFTEGSKWTTNVLMFIGASPGSTGGGIRTTTLAVIIVTIFSKLMGRKDVIFMKRRIDNDIVLQSFMIFFISLFLIILGTVVLYSAVPDKTKYTFSEYVIECTSAFGTVGLSCGITSEVKWWGGSYLIFLMFVGQLGVINSLLAWTKHNPRFNSVEYPYEDIKIG